MKKFTIQLALLFCATSLFAQWIPVNNGLPDYPPTDIIAWVDTMVVSTYGGGIYKTSDYGENWEEMPGILPNLFVNDIRYNGGQFDPISVATEGGPFICVNGAYIDCNGTGLTNPSTNFFSGGNIGITGDGIVGTNGDGVFAAAYTSPFIYDWATSNAGLTGDALTVNDAVAGDGFAYLATNDGFYKAIDDETVWSAKNNGLSGDALKINMISYFGVFFIATDGGLYYSLDLAETWEVLFSDGKFKVAFYVNSEISPSGYMFYAFGENSYYTEDFIEWVQLDFGGIQGEVTAAGSDSENLYIGFTTEKKDGKLGGGLYRRPLEQFLVGIEDNNKVSNRVVLEQNFPNPFINSTQIAYRLEKPGFVCIKVYDLLGTELQTLVGKTQQAGRHVITFESQNLSPGIYYYSIFDGKQKIVTKKMIISE